MAKIDVNKVELVWPGKYNDDGSLKEVPRVQLPFQVIETVNESRASREAAKKPETMSLFDVYEGDEGDTFEDGWKNKLIWGDNLLVMGSLLEKFAGKVDLIYIDPPFASGMDYSFNTKIGEQKLDSTKDQSALEEKAYRDTWGLGVQSYLDTMYPRLVLLRELLSESGALFLHCDYHVSHHLRALLGEVFGPDAMRSQIAWKSAPGHSDSSALGVSHNVIHFYTKSKIDYTWNEQYQPYDEDYLATHYQKADPDGHRFEDEDLTAYGLQGGGYEYEWNGLTKLWRRPLESMKELEAQGRIYYTSSGIARKKRYLDEMPGAPLSDLWTDIARINSQASERLDYGTQKPEALLSRIVSLCSDKGHLVADFFCGSGTTCAIAEKLGRRWIGCDLSRWGIHVTRKRLLGIENCNPFEVLNLGKYERKYWAGVTFGDKKSDDQMTIYEYLAFILKLYNAQPLSGTQHLHGKKGKVMVHVGAVDAPVTIDEVNACIEECLAVKQDELHILGWEWEMGMSPYIVQEAKRRGIKLLLLAIPREVMEQQAVDKGDIKFFELAHVEVGIKQLGERKVQIELTDFAFPYSDLIPEDVREKITKWSDYVDYENHEECPAL